MIILRRPRRSTTTDSLCGCNYSVLALLRRRAQSVVEMPLDSLLVVPVPLPLPTTLIILLLNHPTTKAKRQRQPSAISA